MQTAHHRASGTGHGDLEPGISRTSAYTARSSKADKKARSTRSFWEAAATMIAGACTDCFAPNSISGISSASSTSASQHKSWPGQFSFQEICPATSNFSEQNKIGRGNFGTVYKGKLRDGSIIAVKLAHKNMNLSAEFRSAIETLTKVEHLTLVKFLGHLEHQNECLILLEYVSSGTLREHLDGSRGEPLGFSQRLNIAIDIVHAIAYLHGYTDQLRAKVVYARLAMDDPTETMLGCTPGYDDPEYWRTNHITERSDVYSFGVLLVELITGRRPIEVHRGPQQRRTTQWALRKCWEGEVVVAMDPRMSRTSAAVAAVESMMALAAECMAPDRAARPAMRRCTEVLWSIRRHFQQKQPAALRIATGTYNAYREQQIKRLQFP